MLVVTTRVLITQDTEFHEPIIFLGGEFVLSAGVYATLHEPYYNPLGQRVFDEQGRTAGQPGGVRLAIDNPQNRVAARDWGARPDTPDAHIPIQQAIDSMHYPTSSVGKVGEVDLDGGTYLCGDSIFSGFDWIARPTWWGQHDAPGATTCHRGKPDSPHGMKQFVVLRGNGHSVLKYTGDYAPTKYVLYVAGGSSAKAFDCIDGVEVYGRYKCRGAYFCYHTYSRGIPNITVKHTVQVGLDIIGCFGSRIDNVFTLNCRGFAVRMFGVANTPVRSINTMRTMGHRAEWFPAPDDETVWHEGKFVQHKPWERAGIFCKGGTGTFESVLSECGCMGTGMWTTVADDRLTCAFYNNALTVGDPVYVAKGGIATTVASTKGIGSFTLEDPCEIAGKQLIYRRCTEITRDVEGVFTCQNHGLAEGMWIKLETESGMVELNERWMRVKYIDENSFSLWTWWDEDNPVPFRNVLNTSNFSEADGTERILSGVPMLRINGILGKWTSIRGEGMSGMFFAPVIIGDASTAIEIDGMMLDNWHEGVSDWAVVVEDRAQFTVRRVRGNGVRRAITMHHLPRKRTGAKADRCVVEGNTTYAYQDPYTLTQQTAEWRAYYSDCRVDGKFVPPPVPPP